jgi:hypothetical protein
MQFMYNVNIDGRYFKQCCSGKAISITYSESAFVASGIQHGIRMRHITLSSVACPSLRYFFHTDS